ncbi:hypothetical protein Acsp02_93150 [Actinoplanes sp. NBRC 103695]|nr:hypothetical protein Acsp02_93150 [Actinoplanes sp. NBRC 103695]
MVLATAYPVAACGSRPHNNAGAAAAGPHSMHAGKRFLDPGQDARTRGPGRRCFGGTGAEVAEGDTARVETCATKARSEASQNENAREVTRRRRRRQRFS